MTIIYNHMFCHVFHLNLILSSAYKCPDNVISAAHYNHGTVRVYGSTCYEYVPGNHPWQYAESNCRNKGGHLVHIQNMNDENQVMRFLHDNGFKYAVWLGLHDLSYENYFQWTSGISFHINNINRPFFILLHQ